ncbi:hydrogenase large subunit [Candidimonas nitroreducens]|uniref:Ni,Fe-hydrogenase III large subunit n=1 Tax=Candidimonas nitroreducens TaxID=683354 RepID=A0A225M2S4_9BURK|nr:NADH-quinone oxidoreductase subunit C [Candidimonas nitroreducens]OWT55618.1 Ni,Fe-hydrogenase III large subunit [Candidimonas nitroreducens]
MLITDLELPGSIPLVAGSGNAAIVARVDDARWLEVARAARAADMRLLSLWGSEAADGTCTMHAAYALQDGLLWLLLPTTRDAGYPDLSATFACAARMQRAVADLLGVAAVGAADTRPWLNHGGWPANYHPLAHGATGTEHFGRGTGDYPFVRVAGEGVHEVAVGPIHAGIIEPGHFRFSVVGEKVLRLEKRLGYAHRGIEKLYAGMPPQQGQHLAGRIAGDSTVAFTWAYCMALEQALGVEIPPRAQWLRALLLERERVANHLGDLGALGNDAGLGYGLARFSRLKEDWLRLHDQVFGHRYLMDLVAAGGMAADVTAQDADALRGQCAQIGKQVRELQKLYDEHPGLQDRYGGTGILTAEVAAHFSVCGPAARASGRPVDIRSDHPCPPYRNLAVPKITDTRGDAAARVAVRFGETYASLGLIESILDALPGGDLAAPLPDAGAPCRGLGWVEGWRGDVLVALQLGADGRIERCHCHDPSWQNWPAVEHAAIGNIIADFPLINKSFNLNYAGHDL